MPSAVPDDHAVVIRPFADVLRDLGKGQVADEAAVLLADLVQAVRAHGKQGTFTLTVKVAPMKGSQRNVVVAAQAKTSPPAGEPIAAVFFDDDAGNLHRNDPLQGELDLREVNTTTGELRSTK